MHWNLLTRLVKENPIEGFTCEFLPNGTYDYNMPCYRTKEDCGEYHLEMLRSVNKDKRTIHDDLNLVGLKSLDLAKNRCYLTEGTSDFMSVKLITNENVLGITTLSGNSTTKRIIKALFDEYIIIGDNDSTGISNLMSLSRELKTAGKRSRILIPPAGYNDVSQWLLRCVNSGNVLGNDLKLKFLLEFSY